MMTPKYNPLYVHTYYANEAHFDSEFSSKKK